jgi:biopolymer transport protein ExbB
MRASPSVAASIAAAGLRLADRGPKAADKAMQSAVAFERTRLERWLAYLGTVGNNAPFVGLFGTVVGVVGAFEKLGKGSAPTAAAGQAATQAVMSSIAEALVATAVGILVALPAVAMYNYFQRRIASLLSESEVLTNLVLAYLSDEKLALKEAA